MQMPRSHRHAPVGYPLHVVNRAVDHRQLFFEVTDYQRFIDLGGRSSPVQRLTGGHSCQVRKDTATQGRGHVYQGRFWSEAILSDRDFLNVQRYIEANPLKAKLVGRAERWQWSSLWERETGGRALLDPSPVALPADWVATVNTPIVVSA
jgi:REP-associated tyrosine transposase